MESVEIKQFVENALAASKFNWTVLGAPPSMEIFFAMIRGDTMIVPGCGPPALPTISPVDVGEIAAQAVLRNVLVGKRIRMVGPEAISFPEAAERIAAVRGRNIKFRNLPLFPLRIASIISRPFFPYLHHILESVRLMNHFPQGLVSEVVKDHK